jgi:hypothetical protein
MERIVMTQTNPNKPNQFELEAAIDYLVLVVPLKGDYPKVVGKLRTNDYDERGVPSSKALGAVKWEREEG